MVNINDNTLQVVKQFYSKRRFRTVSQVSIVSDLDKLMQLEITPEGNGISELSLIFILVLKIKFV